MPSERASLVMVLCQILHLKNDEAKVISSKWAVKSGAAGGGGGGGGFVGWLAALRPPPPPSTLRHAHEHGGRAGAREHGDHHDHDDLDVEGREIGGDVMDRSNPAAV